MAATMLPGATAPSEVSIYDWSAADGAATRQQLQSLERAESFYLQEARTAMGKRKTRRIYGMCGRIQAWGLSEKS